MHPGLHHINLQRFIINYLGKYQKGKSKPERKNEKKNYKRLS